MASTRSTRAGTRGLPAARLGMEVAERLGARFMLPGNVYNFVSTQHNPEFTMLEFYQAYSEYRELMTMTEEMIASVARETLGTTAIRFGEHEISLEPPYRRVSLREGAREVAAARLGKDVSLDDLRSRECAAALAKALGLHVEPSWQAGRIATEIFELSEASLDSADLRLRFPH